VDRKYAEPIVERVVESPFGRGARQIDVGGRDHSHINPEYIQASQALDFSFLQEAQ
jgi:hypothetical protein